MAKISLDDIAKFSHTTTSSHTNNNFTGNDAFTSQFHINFSNELAPVFLVIYDSWERLAPRALLPEQISHFSFTKKVIKKILQTTDLLHF